MPSLSRFKKIAAICVGTVSGATLYYANKNQQDGKGHAFASWTTNYIPSPNCKWDENWDHRAPKYLVNPKKRSVAEKDDNDLNELLETKKSTAVRHLFLIRHGQYNLEGLTDSDRTLTKLGCEQAAWTGKRLKDLGIPFTELVKSTMTRAQETASIISKSLPDVPVRDCNLIREGAPIPPEPPVGHWKPEVHFYQDGARIEAAFRNYFHRADPEQEQDSYTILVCHANVIRYFVCRALQFPAEAWLRLSLHHASITWISISPSGKVILRIMGGAGHMPPELMTSR